MKWLLALYPATWRARFGDELAALLEECPSTPLTAIDLIVGAIDAWRTPPCILAGEVSMTLSTRDTLFYRTLLVICLVPLALFWGGMIAATNGRLDLLIFVTGPMPGDPIRSLLVAIVCPLAVILASGIYLWRGGWQTTFGRWTTGFAAAACLLSMLVISGYMLVENWPR